MRNLSPLHMATRLRRAVREISSTLTLMPHPQSVPFYSSCIAIMYSNYLMLFLTWAVSSFWQPFETSQVSLSKAIRYNAPWQPAPAFTLSPEEDVADQGLGKHALHHHLGHHRLLPIAGSWGMGVCSPSWDHGWLVWAEVILWLYQSPQILAGTYWYGHRGRTCAQVAVSAEFQCGQVRWILGMPCGARQATCKWPRLAIGSET